MHGWMSGLALALALTGCATDREEETTPKEIPMPERIDDSDRAPAPVTGEVPADLLDAIKADLAARQQAGVEAIQVLRAEAVVWRDGSLGCPKPGLMYTQALVDGYWVVLRLNGREWDYRAGDRKHFMLCEGGGKPPLDGNSRI